MEIIKNMSLKINKRLPLTDKKESVIILAKKGKKTLLII